MTTNYLSVTEMPGSRVSREQIERLCARYVWAGGFCDGKDVVEAGCGPGQGLGYLQEKAKSLVAGDTCEETLAQAREHYSDRVDLRCFDASDMPFANGTKDVIILLEAIYYLPDVHKFLAECLRILRPGGQVLVVTANKDLSDFTPSPYSYTYWGASELYSLFSQHGFITDISGGTPIDDLSVRQRVLRPVKRVATSLGLIPKTMAGKRLLKRLVFGHLVEMPQEITADTAPFVPPRPISPYSQDRSHKVIYCAATLPKSTLP